MRKSHDPGSIFGFLFDREAHVSASVPPCTVGNFSPTGFLLGVALEQPSAKKDT